MKTSKRREAGDLVEALAEIEHEQWVSWSKAVGDVVPDATRDKWEKSWVAYAGLSERLKEADRIWARKVIALLRRHKLISKT